MTPMLPNTGLTPALIEQVLNLPPAEQDQLVEIVIRTRSEKNDDATAFSPEWKAEIARRIQAVADGTMPTYSLEETMAYLRSVAAEGDHP